MRFENTTIHKVFWYFQNFFWAENFCPNSQKRVFIGCLWLHYNAAVKGSQEKRGSKWSHVTKGYK